LTEEFFNTDHNGDAVAREHPSLNTVMAPMSSASALRMAESALNALDPQLPLRMVEEHNRSLVDYTHGLPPKIDDHRSRHALQTFVLEESPEADEAALARESLAEQHAGVSTVEKGILSLNLVEAQLPRPNCRELPRRA
jgi:hypothetical protein